MQYLSGKGRFKWKRHLDAFINVGREQREQICKCGHGTKSPGNGRILVEKSKSFVWGKEAGKVTLKDVILERGLSLHPENKGACIHSCMFGFVGLHIRLPELPAVIFGLTSDLGRM